MTAATTVGVSERSSHQVLGEALRGHSNGLGFIRLVLASVVIFDHAFPLGGFGEDPLWNLTGRQASLGTIAVAGFFAISGYLIAKSGMSGDVVQFMWRRSLRIFPAYWLVLASTAFLVGPMIWVTAGSALADYFQVAPNGPFFYFTGNWTLNIGTWGIYDIFADTTPYGEAVGYSVFNGSLWTLIYEWNCYLLIAILVVFGVLGRARIVVPLLAGLFLILQIVALTNPSGLGSIAPYLNDANRVNLTFVFLLGSTLAVYSKQIPYHDALGIFAGVAMLTTLRFGGFLTLGQIAGAYFVMYLAVRLPKVLHKVGARNDYSYGVYIYGFLVQQVTAYLGWYRWGYLPWTLAVLVLTFACAWVSWHGLERWALALKDWGPGRGAAYWVGRVRALRPAQASVGAARTSQENDR